MTSSEEIKTKRIPWHIIIPIFCVILTFILNSQSIPDFVKSSSLISTVEYGRTVQAFPDIDSIGYAASAKTLLKKLDKFEGSNLHEIEYLEELLRTKDAIPRREYYTNLLLSAINSLKQSQNIALDEKEFLRDFVRKQQDIERAIRQIQKSQSVKCVAYITLENQSEKPISKITIREESASYFAGDSKLLKDAHFGSEFVVQQLVPSEKIEIYAFKDYSCPGYYSDPKTRIFHDGGVADITVKRHPNGIVNYINNNQFIFFILAISVFSILLLFLVSAFEGDRIAKEDNKANIE